MNSLYQQDLVPQAGKEYKVFLVEVDDEDRERVIVGRSMGCEINSHYDYSDIHSDYSNLPMARFATSQEVTMTLKLKPIEGDTFFRIENFADEE